MRIAHVPAGLSGRLLAMRTRGFCDVKAQMALPSGGPPRSARFERGVRAAHLAGRERLFCYILGCVIDALLFNVSVSRLRVLEEHLVSFCSA